MLLLSNFIASKGLFINVIVNHLDGFQNLWGNFCIYIVAPVRNISIFFIKITPIEMGFKTILSKKFLVSAHYKLFGRHQFSIKTAPVQWSLFEDISIFFKWPLLKLDFKLSRGEICVANLKAPPENGAILGS